MKRGHLFQQGSKSHILSKSPNLSTSRETMKFDRETILSNRTDLCVSLIFVSSKKPAFSRFLDSMMVPMEDKSGGKKIPKLQICEIEIYVL